MGGICPFCPARRVAPMDGSQNNNNNNNNTDQEDSSGSHVVVHFSDVPAIVIGNGHRLDVSVQTDLRDELRWAYELNAINQNQNMIMQTIVHHDSSFNNNAEDEVFSHNDDNKNSFRRVVKKFSKKESEDELEMGKFRDQVSDFDVILGVFYDGSELISKAMTIDHSTQPLTEIFKTVQLFDWKNCDHYDPDLRKRVDACDGFLIFLPGERLIEQAVENFHRFLPNGNSELRINPFYGKPTSIASDGTPDIELVKEFRHFLATIGAVVLPTILTSTNQLGENQAVSELKLYTTALKLITKAAAI